MAHGILKIKAFNTPAFNDNVVDKWQGCFFQYHH